MKVNFHSTGALDKSLATKFCTNPTNTIPPISSPFHAWPSHAPLVTLPGTVLKTSSKPVYIQDQNPAYLKITPLITMPPTTPSSDI